MHLQYVYIHLSDFDIVKIVIATLLGKTVRYAITKAGLIQKAA